MILRTALHVLAVMAVAVSAGAADLVAVTPREEESVVLHNPDMGWVVYENYPLDAEKGGSSTLLALPEENFDAVDAVAMMFSWQDVERREGAYDFSKADYAYDYWRKRGKRVQLRMSTESLLWWTNRNPPAGRGVPDYVLERLPAERKQVRLCEGIPYAVVDAREPYYLARLERFLAEVAGHFSEARGRPVTLVDLRGFGLWGEWHTGFQYATLADRRAALVGVIDRYAAAFRENDVALSASYDPDSPRELRAGPTDRFDEASTKTYDAFLRYSAFDHALAVANVTFRRDGAGGAVHSNERKLMDEAFRTLTKGPMFSEFVDGYGKSKQGRKGWVDWKVADALSLHPNYVNLLGWQGADARDFMVERADLVALGLRTMGYRLVPTRVRFPAVIRPGEAVGFESEWVNRGVGRAMRDYRLRLTLTDAEGKAVGVADGGATGCDRWVKGQVYRVARAVTFGAVKAGRYGLRVSLIDPKGGGAIGLPLAKGDGERRYEVGVVEVP